MFEGYAGAAIPRLQKLMDDAAKAAAPIPNATIMDENDRAVSTQLYWMMLMICKGTALNIVFFAGDSEGLPAWRQLSEKYEPKMRTRFAGQLMSILSSSFQGDTAEWITVWEREIATYERDSGKTLDDEIKVGAVLLKLPESQKKTNLLMRVDKLKKWTDFRDEVVAISRAIAVAQSQPTRMDIGALGKGKSGKGSKGSIGAGKLNNQTQQACSRCGNTDGPLVVRRAREVAKVRMLPRLVGIVVSRSVRIHHCESGGQPRHNHGWIGRKLLRCWQHE